MREKRIFRQAGASGAGYSLIAREQSLMCQRHCRIMNERKKNFMAGRCQRCRLFAGVSGAGYSLFVIRYSLLEDRR
jgi:hypothetical protein